MKFSSRPGRWCQTVRPWIPVLIVGLSGGCHEQTPGTHFAPSKPAESVADIPGSLRIRLTGTDHRWRVEYPALGGSAVTLENLLVARRMPVPIDTDIVLLLNSTDYIYTLEIPQFGVKEIAVPDLEFQMAFRPSQAGTFPLIGEELCGGPNGQEPGLLVVMPRQEFLQWHARQGSTR